MKQYTVTVQAEGDLPMTAAATNAAAEALHALGLTLQLAQTKAIPLGSDDFRNELETVIFVDTPRGRVPVSLGDLIAFWTKAQGPAYTNLTPGKLIAATISDPHPIPVATDDQIQRHAEKQQVSWSDAWRYFERQGYDMTECTDQY